MPEIKTIVTLDDLKQELSGERILLVEGKRSSCRYYLLKSPALYEVGQHGLVQDPRFVQDMSENGVLLAKFAANEEYLASFPRVWTSMSSYAYGGQAHHFPFIRPDPSDPSLFWGLEIDYIRILKKQGINIERFLCETRLSDL